MQQANRAELRQFYDRHRRLSAEEREDLFPQINQAHPLTRDPALVEASALMAQGPLAEQPSVVIGVIAWLESELERLFAQHPDHDLFDSLPRCW